VDRSTSNRGQARAVALAISTIAQPLHQLTGMGGTSSRVVGEHLLAKSGSAQRKLLGL